MSNRTEREILFQPIRIGTITLKNRIAMPPMGTGFIDSAGFPTRQMLDYIEERAKGGVGLIVLEGAAIEPRGRLSSKTSRIDDDKYLPAASQLAEVIKKHGAMAAMEVIHGGREAPSSLIGCQPVAPSPIPGRSGEIPEELTIDGIKEIIEHFAQGILRIKKAGFDGAVIHAAHAYLLAQFMSAAINKRQDEYGGDIRGRAKIVVDIIKAAKELTGRDFPIWPRINAQEYGIEGGITLEEAQGMARLLQEAGADAIDVSCRGWGKYNFINTPEVPGFLLPLAEGIKKVVQVPVFAVGFLNPEIGARAIKQGKADIINIGRGLIADPEIPRKVAEGRLEDIVPCISCYRCLESLIFKGEGLKCAVNPAAGRERECRIPLVEKRKRIVIVGGGPAGMEAARIAAERGYEVTLLEKRPYLGGRMVLAAIPPGKENITKLIDCLSTQVKKLNIQIRLNEEADASLIQDIRPDAVIIACGGEPFIPEIPGLDKTNAVSFEDVLMGKVEVGEKVFVIGGEMVGCETADFLAEKGRKVTIATLEPKIGASMMPVFREIYLDTLTKKGITMISGVNYEKIEEKTVHLLIPGREKKTIETDTIVIATGFKPNTALLKSLQSKVPEVKLIGDALQPRKIMEAIAEGFDAAQAL